MRTFCIVPKRTRWPWSSLARPLWWASGTLAALCFRAGLWLTGQRLPRRRRPRAAFAWGPSFAVRPETVTWLFQMALGLAALFVLLR
ncbi:MAG: hypothetical protein ACOZNI_19475 [Myxococcota bacterium]